MEYIVLAGAIVLLIALIMGSEYVSSRKYQKNYLEKIYRSYGMVSERNYKEGEMEHIKMYYLKHLSEQAIDDITWNDLNMDHIYRKINVSCSAAGDEYLYYRLRTPICDEAQMQREEERIRFFMEHEEERHKVQCTLFGLGRMGKYSIYEYLENLDTLGERNNIQYALRNLFLVVSVGIMFLSLPVGIVALMAVLCYNFVGYFKEYKHIEPYITSFRYISRLLTVRSRWTDQDNWNGE